MRKVQANLKKMKVSKLPTKKYQKLMMQNYNIKQWSTKRPFTPNDRKKEPKAVSGGVDSTNDTGSKNKDIPSLFEFSNKRFSKSNMRLL